jgi:hypothetical protein
MIARNQTPQACNCMWNVHNHATEDASTVFLRLTAQCNSAPIFTVLQDHAAYGCYRIECCDNAANQLPTHETHHSDSMPSIHCGTAGVAGADTATGRVQAAAEECNVKRCCNWQLKVSNADQI